MTTTVKVTAHCSKDKQVQIVRSNLTTGEYTATVIQHGETNEQSVYDGWLLSVQEELKPVDGTVR